MNTIERNPDVALHKNETVPPRCYIHEGKQLMLVARACKPPVPYGLATKRTYIPGTTDSRIETVGLVIREVDRERFELALANKNSHKAKSS